MKINGRLFIILINIITVLLLSSCSKEENKLYFEISETQLYAPKQETQLEVTILTDIDWEIILQPDWIQVTSEESDKLRITVLENQDYSLRKGKIEIKASDTVFEIDIYQASFTESFQKCYVTFDPVGHEGNHLFKVYAQSLTKPNYYWGFTIARELDLSDDVYSDQYRIIYCKEYAYNGNEMIPTESILLHYGESEFTYKRAGASDLTGGYHGNEIFSEIYFFIDDYLMDDITTEFILRPCERFSYTQKSTMHRDDNVHTEDADHLKVTEISESGYFTKNIITGKNNIPINVCFGSIAAISIDVAKRGYASNPQKVITFNQNGSRKLEGYNDTLRMWSSANNLSVDIESEFSFYNTYAVQYIWDNPYYGKYYRYFQNVNLGIGESWTFKTKITFDKL